MTSGLLGLAAMAAFTSAMPALAADMAVKAKARPAAAEALTWTGCYIGGYLGGAWANGNVDATSPVSTTTPPFFYQTNNATAANNGRFNFGLDSSIAGGGTLGCNWQATNSSFVVGLEGEGGYLRLDRTVVDPYSVGPGVNYNGDTSDRATIGNGYGAVTGRLGWTFGRTLLYGKAGVGFTRVAAGVSDTSLVPPGTATLVASSSANVAFAVGGGGIEWAWTDRWSLKAEYLFLGVQKTLTFCGPAGGTGAGNTFCGTSSFNGVHTVKAGLNYRFDWWSAPVAKTKS
jgi:outer membrane immunogenic protein